MRQLLLLILLFFIGQWLVKTIRRADANAARRGPSRSSGAADAAGAAGPGARATNEPRLAEPMVRCTDCGVHTPKSDSVVVAGQHFCCAQHAQRYAARPTGREAR
jgi:uncharacterized protein